MSKSNLLVKLGTSALLLSLVPVFALTTSSKLQAQETDPGMMEEIDGNTNLEDIEDIEENTTELMGDEVTVRGEVSQVQPGLSFTINEEGFFQGAEVLVINVSGEMLPEMTTDENIQLQITGEVGEFVYADVDSLYDLDLDPDLYVDYENKPVIFASSLALSPSLEEISENPDNFYSKEVALEGEVSEVKSDSAFVITEDELIGGDDMLVVNVTGEPMPSEEQKVVVTGMVRPFVAAEFERDYDLTWDLDFQKEIEAEFSEKPVLVVDGIYPVEDEGVLE